MSDNDPFEVWVSLPEAELRAIFDCAVHSMDFGSDFWDTEQTEAARAIAVRLGVDPMEATPSSHRTHYPHPYAPHDWTGYGPGEPHPTVYERCETCDKTIDHPCHAVEVTP